MATWLRVSTAVDIKIGPLLDDTDGKTAEIALTISQADVRLAKNNGNWAQKNETTSAAHEENGWYEVNLNTTDTDTLGILIVAVNESGALPVWREFLVVTANIYDSYFSTDLIQTDVTQLLGTAWATPATAGLTDVNVKQISTDGPAADNAEAFFDGAGYAGTGNTIPTVTNVTTVNGLAANVITAASLAADAVTEIRSLVSGTSDAGGSTTTMVDAALTQADANYWKGKFILFTSGSVIGQIGLITIFDQATDTITFAPAATQSIGVGITYEILATAAGFADLKSIDGGVTSGNNATLNLKQLNIVNSTGDAFIASSTGSNGKGINASGNGTGEGVRLTGGMDGRGLYALGGSTAGNGVEFQAISSGYNGLQCTGNGVGGSGIGVTGGGAGVYILGQNDIGLRIVGGDGNIGLRIDGGSTSGVGVSITTSAGDGVSITPTAGNALVLTAQGTSKHGAVITGGTAGTSDGVKAVAGTGGVDIRGNVTGNLSGSVNSVATTVTANTTQIEGVDATNQIRDSILSDATTFAGASISAIKAKTDNLPSGIKKNTTLNNFEFLMIDSTDHITPKTGLSFGTGDSKVSIDGGAFANTANNAAEVANGIYKINLDAADLNGDVVTLRFAISGADPRLITIKTSV
jgi:hypothetical protein